MLGWWDGTLHGVEDTILYLSIITTQVCNLHCIALGDYIIHKINIVMMKQWIIEELFLRFNKHCSARAIFNFDIPIISSLQPSEKSYLNCWLHKSSNQETDIRLEYT